MNSILQNRILRVENSSLKTLEFMPQKPRLKMQFENSISDHKTGSNVKHNHVIFNREDLSIDGRVSRDGLRLLDMYG
jgi:hypothetical protein